MFRRNTVDSESERFDRTFPHTGVVMYSYRHSQERVHTHGHSFTRSGHTRSRLPQSSRLCLGVHTCPQRTYR